MVKPEYRAMFISDVHLGTRASMAADLIGFLRDHDAETIYLVGDMVDFWRLKRGTFWPQSHNDVLQKLLRKVRKGSRLIYIPGNHDEALRDFIGSQFGGIEIVTEAVHDTADGRRLLVVHGDAFDGVVSYARWLSLIGDYSYELAVWTNSAVNRVRRLLGLEYWSLSQHLKFKVKRAVSFISRFEEAVAGEAHRRGFDGVVCGHIHHAAARTIGPVEYFNCGDWVETCSALVEGWDGQIRLVRWHDAPAARVRDAATSALIAAET